MPLFPPASFLHKRFSFNDLSDFPPLSAFSVLLLKAAIWSEVKRLRSVNFS